MKEGSHSLALLIGALIRGRRRFRWYGPAVNSFHTPMSPIQQPSGLEILRQRYARGEIDGTTHEQIRERLEKTVNQN